VGEGFPSDQRDRYIYDRLVSKKFNFDSDNIAVGGSSNHKIFMRSSAAMLSNKYDLVITQWTALNRIWLSPGPDANFFVNDTSYPDYRYRDFYLSSSQKQFIRNTLLLMNHDYQNIIDLVDYCKILAALETTTTKAIFINGLVPWNSDLVDSLSSDLSSCLSSYSKELLDFNNRSDQEIIEIFEKLQHNLQS
jgi:acetyl esterase/lipase